ncbi:MAG: hypothetical protein JNN07_00605 [Verrucomicrobiales bacterium]|nr:hypothetical protein [Verrucomicrobiales bacterium]
MLSSSSVMGSERYVTLTAKAGKTNSIEIASGEALQLVSMPTHFARAGTANLSVFRDGQPIASRLQAHGAVQPFIISGPAKVTFTTQRPNDFPKAIGFATLRIFDQPYPPSGTLVIPPVVGGGVLSLESSTNLVTWQSATNGIYTNHPSAKFFRLDLKRID